MIFKERIAGRVVQSAGIAQQMIAADMELGNVSLDFFEGVGVLAQKHADRGWNDQLADLLVDCHGAEGRLYPGLPAFLAVVPGGRLLEARGRGRAGSNNG